MTEKEIAGIVEWAERVSVLEVKVERLPAIEKKLDELLELRYKGVGAFWLASALFGTGLIGTVMSFIAWLRA